MVLVSAKKILPAITGAAFIATIGSFNLINTASADQAHMNASATRYKSNLLPLNDSGVSGNATIKFDGTDLQVKIRASGLEPNQPHVAHIHGSLTGVDAMCPSTTGDDANNDGFLSVFEGAPKYGPIKLNLTKMQTPFGPNANTTLFAPFAGTPNVADFPQVGDNGRFKLNTTYSFDLSKTADKQAYDSLKQLDKQHIVIHGAYAPESVDTAGGSNERVYDPLLPVACGEIRVVGGQNGQESVQMHMSPANHSHTSNSTQTSITNTNSQSSVSGDATSTDNTSSSDVMSGEAQSSNTATFNIEMRHSD